MPEVNWIAVALCGVSSLVLGGLWYSPALFARSWQTAAGLSDENAFDAGIRDLRRTAEADGVFCYTFFKALARAQ